MKGKNTSKVICHIPHSSVVILNPKGILKDITQEEIQAELNLVTDLRTEKIWAKGETIVFPANRLYCDVERLDDSLEPMAKFGRGIAYTKFDSGKTFRETSLVKKEVLHVYNEHTKRITAAVDKKLEEFGTCLIIDCHSFNDIPLETDLDKTIPRPDICIGTDSFHTPSLLKEITDDIFRSYDYSIKVNSPYSGCYIPLKHLHKDTRVMGIMVEINKKLYLDENFEIIPDGYNKLEKVVDLFLAVMNISDFSNQDIQTKTTKQGLRMLNRMNSFLSCTDNLERRALLKSLLIQDNISFTEDAFKRGLNYYCKGSSKFLVVAHYDSVYSEYSANDNTASIVNLLEIKKLNPELNIAFLDSEEPPYFAAGSKQMAQRMINEELELPEFVINLELTGRGNNWYLGENQGEISTRKLQDFKKCTEIMVPISDSTRFLEHDIDAVVLTLIPGSDTSIIYKCHTEEDTIENISIPDMQIFVEEFSSMIKTWA